MADIDIEKLKQHPWYELVHESNKIEGFPDNVEMDLASLRALEALSILDTEVGLNHMIIRKIQEDITKCQPDLWDKYKGSYRSTTMTDVSVGGKNAPSYMEVQSLMEQWLENFQKRTPKENHIEFERIHPFADGNGRTGRILMWWQEMADGGEPTLIRYDERWEYYRWFM